MHAGTALVVAYNVLPPLSFQLNMVACYPGFFRDEARWPPATPSNTAKGTADCVHSLATVIITVGGFVFGRVVGYAQDGRDETTVMADVTFLVEIYTVVMCGVLMWKIKYDWEGKPVVYYASPPQ